MGLFRNNGDKLDQLVDRFGEKVSAWAESYLDEEDSFEMQNDGDYEDADFEQDELDFGEEEFEQEEFANDTIVCLNPEYDAKSDEDWVSDMNSSLQRGFANVESMMAAAKNLLSSGKPIEAVKYIEECYIYLFKNIPRNRVENHLPHQIWNQRADIYDKWYAYYYECPKLEDACAEALKDEILREILADDEVQHMGTEYGEGARTLSYYLYAWRDIIETSDYRAHSMRNWIYNLVLTVIRDNREGVFYEGLHNPNNIIVFPDGRIVIRKERLTGISKERLVAEELRGIGFLMSVIGCFLLPQDQNGISSLGKTRYFMHAPETNENWEKTILEAADKLRRERDEMSLPRRQESITITYDELQNAAKGNELAYIQELKKTYEKVIVRVWG